MKVLVFIGIIFLSLSFSAVEARPTCAEFTSRSEFVEYVTENRVEFDKYDKDSDGVACEGNWAVHSSEIPYPLDIMIGCSSGTVCETMHFKKDQEKIVMHYTETDKPELVYNAHNEQLLSRGYSDITGTPSEEGLELSMYESYKVYWNSQTNRVVIIVINENRALLIEYNNFDDVGMNEMIEEVFATKKLPKEVEGYTERK